MYFCTKVMFFVFYFISSFFLFNYFVFTLLIREILSIFHLCSMQLLRLKTICWRGNKQVDVHLRWIVTVHFLSKGRKCASNDGRDGQKSCLFPVRVGTFDFDVIIQKVLLPICTLIWRVNNYVSRQEMVKIEEMKVQKTPALLLFCSTDDNTQYC